MRIAMFTETYLPFLNGVVSHVVMLKKAFESLGHEVLVVTVSDTKKVNVVDGVLHCPGVRVDRQYGYRIIAPGTFSARMSALRAFQPDIIHIHNEYSVGLFALRAARTLNVPVVYSIHMDFDKFLIKIPGMMTFFRPLVSRYLRRFTAKSDCLVSMSPKAKMYIERTGVKRDVLNVPNAVEVARYAGSEIRQEEAFGLRRKHQIGPETVLFLSVGRLDAEKNVDDLIQSFLSLDLPADKAVLLILGTGQQERALRKLASASDGKVRLVGAVPHAKISAYYHAADYYITASLSEMHSIAMLEAMASGLYTLMRRDPPNTWQISCGENGEIWNDKDDLKHQVENLLAETGAKKQARRERVIAWSKQRDVSHQAEQMIAIYQDEIDKRKG